MDWTAVIVISLLSLASIHSCQAYSLDLIKSMPGLLKQPSFNMYSGYLDGTGMNKIHYWFMESQHAVTDPLIIWLSGGPGCSALYSLLTSNGPFRVRPDGVNLDYNANSWNLNANMLYIDAPVGTGFSYAADGSSASWNDTGVTEDVLQGLLSFFTKFPQSTLSYIYVAGDGYAGVFAPLLLQKLDSVSEKLPLQIKGMAVGNPQTSLTLQDNSLVYYAYGHGIIGEELWSTLNVSCCTPQGSCNFHNNTNKACITAISETYHDLMSIGINPYKVNGNCASGVPASPGRGKNQKDGFYHYATGMQHIFANYGFQQKEQKRIKGIPPWKLKADLPCVDTMAVANYLNSAEVRSALHVTNTTAEWQMCNATVEHYYTEQYSDMSSIYTALLNTYKYRLLVYSGDQDATYNLLGSQWFVTSLQRQAEVQWRPWLYESALKQDQVGGFVQEYESIAFLTVKNAGFWAARDQPLATSQLIFNFINRRPYQS